MAALTSMLGMSLDDIIKMPGKETKKTAAPQKAAKQPKQAAQGGKQAPVLKTVQKPVLKPNPGARPRPAARPPRPGATTLQPRPGAKEPRPGPKVATGVTLKPRPRPQPQVRPAPRAPAVYPMSAARPRPIPISRAPPPPARLPPRRPPPLPAAPVVRQRFTSNAFAPRPRDPPRLAAPIPPSQYAQRSFAPRDPYAAIQRDQYVRAPARDPYGHDAYAQRDVLERDVLERDFREPRRVVTAGYGPLERADPYAERDFRPAPRLAERRVAAISSSRYRSRSPRMTPRNTLRHVRMRNVPPTLRAQDLHKALSSEVNDVVEQVDILRDGSVAEAVVEFRDPRDAEKVCGTYDRGDLNGFTIDVCLE